MRVPSTSERAHRARGARTGERGQILVIIVLALVAVIGMVGLVIDGGALFAQQRVAQNGADGAATAGTVVIAEYMGGATTRDQSERVRRRGGQCAGQRPRQLDRGIHGRLRHADRRHRSSRARARSRPAPRVSGRSAREPSSTTFSRVFGFDTIPASAEATVVAGPLSADCVADDDGCAVVPVTFPVQVSQCDSSGNLIQGPWVGAPPPGSAPGDSLLAPGRCGVVAQCRTIPPVTRRRRSTAILPFCAECERWIRRLRQTGSRPPA